MGLMNSIAQKYLSKAVMDVIMEKCPPLYVFIDSLDEVNLWEAIGNLIEEQQRLSRTLIMGQVINVKDIKKQVEIMDYVIRFFKGKEPALSTLIALLKALEIDKVASVEVTEFIKNMSSIDKKK
ncbi:MAG: hypothetical protein BWY04_01367 [candidate division CPR1 bacterium ADurb.Bin160]|uniref:Uncharacterized protein n=1 Tax=candidate division CPR1 bacterium ADurb.Bin160 TaxID=1852826 RepID=A0A1V5ZJJ2_9BACT|nr:MAG: hypothetical protein BWY04_01367 [candidate division CPR1 bacterium ADurb.Bin160]